MIETEAEYRQCLEIAEAQANRIDEYAIQLRSELKDETRVRRGLDPIRSFHLGLIEEIDCFEASKRGE